MWTGVLIHCDSLNFGLYDSIFSPYLMNSTAMNNQEKEQEKSDITTRYDQPVLLFQKT